MTFILFVDVLREKNIKLQNKKEREKNITTNRTTRIPGPVIVPFGSGGPRAMILLFSLSLSPLRFLVAMTF